MIPGAISDAERQALLQYVNNRMGGLRIDRYSWWLHWRDIADYIIPRRYRWLITPNQMNRGSPINQKIVDSTGSIALRTLGAGMMSGITSPSSPWFRLTLEDKNLAERTQVRQWLDQVADRMRNVFAQSNFYTSIQTMYGDLGAFGTAVVTLYEDREDVMRCYNACAGEYFLANSSRMQIDTYYREYTQTVTQVASEFGKENCSISIQQAVKNGGNQSMEVVVGHAIEPNSNFVEGLPGLGGMPFREVYWEYSTAGGGGSGPLLRYRGFHEFPTIAPRWDVVGSDAYGRSPGMDALGDIKQLQVETKRKAQAIDKMVNPPLLADPMLKNEPATALPGGITYVPLTAGTVGMKPLYEVKPDISHMMEDIHEVQNRIKSVFFYDLFMMISQLDTTRSAQEIIQRKEEKMIQLGPVLERFQNEALDPAIDRLFNIMSRAGLLPPPPAMVKGGMTIKVEYVSVLAQAQKAALTSGIERLASFVGNIAAGNQGQGGSPEILDNIDWDEMVDLYADFTGVPSKVIIPFAKVLKLRAERAAKQQQTTNAQNLMAGVQGAKVMSETEVGGGQNALQMALGNR